MRSVVSCSDCGYVAYCNQGCQDADADHGFECCWLQQHFDSGSTNQSLVEVQLLVGRLARRRSRKCANYDISSDHVGSAFVGASSWHLHTADAVFQGALRRDILAQLQVVQGLCPMQLDEIMLLRLFGQHFANSFSIQVEVHKIDGRAQRYMAIGVGLYLGVSLVNHDCTPNCWVHFNDKGKLSLRTLRQIAHNEPLSICYLEHPMPSFVRRAQLQSTYGFSCSCLQCRGDQAISPVLKQAWAIVQSAEAARLLGQLSTAEWLYRDALSSINAVHTDTGHTSPTDIWAVLSKAKEGLARVVICDHRWPAAVELLQQAYAATIAPYMPRSEDEAVQLPTESSIGLRALEVACLHSTLSHHRTAVQWAVLAQHHLQRTHGRTSSLAFMARRLTQQQQYKINGRK